MAYSLIVLKSTIYSNVRVFVCACGVESEGHFENRK